MKLIDIVTIAPKSQEASVNHSNALRHNVHAQEQAQMHFANEIQHDSKKPVEVEKDQLTEYQYGKSKEGSGGQQGQSRKRKEQNEEKPEILAPNSTFDIKI